MTSRGYEVLGNKTETKLVYEDILRKCHGPQESRYVNRVNLN